MSLLSIFLYVKKKFIFRSTTFVLVMKNKFVHESLISENPYKSKKKKRRKNWLAVKKKVCWEFNEGNIKLKFPSFCRLSVFISKDLCLKATEDFFLLMSGNVEIVFLFWTTEKIFVYFENSQVFLNIYEFNLP